MKKWWDDTTILRARRAWRLIVLSGGTILLWYWGWDYQDKLPEINGLLVLIGAVSVGIFFAKVWKEP
jgi:hypothetical protein